MRSALTVFALALSAAALSSQEPAPIPAVAKLRFGVYTSEKASEMYKSFAPVIEDLETLATAHLGRFVVIEVRIYGTYDEALEAFLAKDVDFVRFGPASYVLAKERSPAIELLAAEVDDGAKRSKGVIFVRQDSPVQKLEDLAGRTFAFGDENSTIGRYLAQAELAAAGVHAKHLKSFRYLGRHDVVVRAVQVGDFHAGSAHIATFEKMNQKGDLRALVTFDNISKPWIARAGLDEPLREALRQAVLDLKRPASLKALKVTGFQTASDDDYDFVRDGMKRARDFDPPAASPAPPPDKK